MSSGYGSSVNHARYRWELTYSPSSITSSVSSVRVRLRLWYQTVDWWRIDDPSTTLHISGSFNTSQTVYIKLMARGVNSQEQLIYDNTITVNTAYGRGVGVSFNAWHTGAWSNMNPSASGSVTIPARPYQPPGAPSAVNARRVSDNQVVISYNAPSSGSGPVSSVVLNRSVDGGAFSYLTTVNGAGAKTYTDTSTSSGHFYRYQVASRGPGGQSGYVSTSTVYTTPNPPSNVTAVKNGTDIVLSWVNNARGSYTTKILEDGGVIATVGAGETSFLIAAPSASHPHSYTLKALSPDGLSSSEATSNQVQLAQAPYAPTDLDPSGSYIALGERFELSWMYNTSDSSAQTRFEIQYSDSTDKPSWRTVKTLDSSENNYQADPVNSVGAFLWRVRTWGQDGSKPSPYSAPARIDVTQAPGVDISVPESFTIIDRAQTTASFTIDQDTQPAYWQALLYKGDQVVASASGSFSDQHGSWRLTGLENGGNYIFEVKAGTKVWGSPARVMFRVKYAAPEPAVLKAGWVDKTGAVQLEVTNPPGGIEVVRNVLLRGTSPADLKPVNTNVGANTVFNDPTPPLNTPVIYQVVAVSRLGTQTPSNPITLPAFHIGGVFLNWGVDGASLAHLKWNVAKTIKPARIYAQEYVFAGQAYPSVIMGSASSVETSINAYIGHPKTPGISELIDGLNQVALEKTPVILRCATSPSLTGYISALSFNTDERGVYSVSFIHNQTN